MRQGGSVISLAYDLWPAKDKQKENMVKSLETFRTNEQFFKEHKILSRFKRKTQEINKEGSVDGVNISLYADI